MAKVFGVGKWLIAVTLVACGGNSLDPVSAAAGQSTGGADSIAGAVSSAAGAPMASGGAGGTKSGVGAAGSHANAAAGAPDGGGSAEAGSSGAAGANQGGQSALGGTGGAPECTAGMGDCNSTPGCETKLGVGNPNGNTVTDCGVCGVSCSLDNVSAASCVHGACVPTCAVGFADCDAASVNNGCETHIGPSGTCGGGGSAGAGGGSAGNAGAAGNGGSSSGGSAGSGGAGGAVVVCECATGQCCDGCHLFPPSHFLGAFPRYSSCSVSTRGDNANLDYYNKFCDGVSADGYRWGPHVYGETYGCTDAFVGGICVQATPSDVAHCEPPPTP